MSGGIARTSATGGGAMLPELLAWSSSLAYDRALVREDLLGSAAHVTMLARTGLVSESDAGALRGALLSMHADAARDAVVIADGEEDVHMAVEAELGRRLGPVAGRLHTARSRNDQVALDLRMHTRGAAVATLGDLAGLPAELVDRAEKERDVALPAYTHRQRAQPISAAFLVLAWTEQLLRAAEVTAFTIDRVNISPLGSGACSGTSLPIDRALVARLLGFPKVSANALDTVGDRDFALDWTWAGARICLALARIAADVIDYATSEFGFVTLDGAIAAGSSMMPQKKNPDIFELVRGKSSRGVSNVMAMLTLVKGLPSGYNRDQQEDRAALLETSPLVRGAVMAVRVALPHVHFVRETCAAALAGGGTQATDLAEALVRTGVPFREAYKAVGELVRRAGDAGVPLGKLDPAIAKSVHPAFNDATLAALEPLQAIAAKESAGGTGPKSIDAQIASARARIATYAEKASTVPSLDAIAKTIAAEPLR